MIAPEAGLSISRQCTLLGIARSSFYYRPRPESAEELELLGRLWQMYLPVGGGFAKVVRLGEQPIKLDLDAYYNAIRPQAGNETWLVQVTVTWQFPD